MITLTDWEIVALLPKSNGFKHGVGFGVDETIALIRKVERKMKEKSEAHESQKSLDAEQK